MVLDQGRIVEFDKYVDPSVSSLRRQRKERRPATLLSDPESKFYGLCKATGPKEFKMLKAMAGVHA